MNYYNNQVALLTAALYPDVYVLRQVMQAKYFMDHHFAEAISLDDISRAACMSKFHLIRSFKKLYGITPHQYLISVRIKKAKQLLQQHIPVAEVCYATGFDSTTSFTALFKKMAGKTPQHFKRTRNKDH